MRQCKKCGNDISNKLASALFCCKKCKKDHWHRTRYPIPAKRLTPEERVEAKKRYKATWKLKHIDKHRATMREYCNKRYKEDILYKLAINMRNRLSVALKGAFKNGKTLDLLGCSIDDLKKHLEARFQTGMSWENHGRTGWHIDHIIPLSSFDLTNPEQLKIACNFKNLQPLWAKDNIRKGNKNPH